MVEGELLFQLDGAPYHRAKIIKIWLQEHEIYMLKWEIFTPHLTLYCDPLAQYKKTTSQNFRISQGYFAGHLKENATKRMCKAR